MSHIPDHELLLVTEDELHAARAGEVRGHLAGCAACRARQTAILQTLGAAMEEHLEQELPPIDGARTMLQDRLRPGKTQRYWALGALAAALVLMAVQFWPERESGLTPRPGLTPGATMAINRETMCATGLEPERAAIPPAVAGEVFRKYGIHDPRPRTYEVDYLIPPDLGGSSEVHNLWPQPYNSGTWNARVKDALEDRLRMMVCAGSLDLNTAQRALADDWIGAYKTYFRTSEPLPDHVAFVKDRPWE